ncbi:PaaI family thioesterase [Sporomusa sp. KB1]|jgi:acyl-CoA thioesterase|uniref:PaaI family thioesterase n=1 Tax=Sporomusa sp. KB1 TaxID=943346 RepID=UPI0011A6BC41|nr:PaaI family thioesterase [Sporomusa sp. KB1]TWH44928.1 acyl-CoA thioesterase [Sporomusa sp. KB1]
MTDLSLLKDHLYTIYSENPFVALLQMEIIELEPGKATLSMPIKNKHTNFYNSAHGGALAALADTAMGMACTTTGKKVVTLDMNLNYIRNVPCQETLTAVGLVIHNGSRTIVATTDIFNNTNQLVVSARATFFVTSTFF